MKKPFPQRKSEPAQEDPASTLLTYAINPSPAILTVGQTALALQLVVANEIKEVVDCQQIIVTLPGPSQLAEDLTDSFTNIGVVTPTDQSGHPTWQVSHSPSSSGVFTLTPLPGAGAIGLDSIEFVFDNITVNDTPGPCGIDIAEVASAPGKPSGSREFPPILLGKWPADFAVKNSPIAYLDGQIATSVPYLSQVAVNWTVTGTDVTCTLQYDPDGHGLKTLPVGTSGPLNIKEPLTAPHVVFTLIATYTPPGQQTPLNYPAPQWTVEVQPDPSIIFGISPNPLLPGQLPTFTLNWNVTDITNFQIVANDGPGGQARNTEIPFSPSGTSVVTPRQLSTTYTLQAIASSSSKT